jgi:la-related protein 1
MFGQGDKLRRRARWEIWLLRRSNYSTGSSSGSLSPVTSNIDSLASHFQSVGLQGTTYYPIMQGMTGGALLTRSATSASIGYQAPTFEGLHSNGSGPIFGQNTSRSLLRSDTF